ncbi:hypothetical protein V2J09_016758 [Rumex salicifolius]
MEFTVLPAVAILGVMATFLQAQLPVIMAGLAHLLFPYTCYAPPPLHLLRFRFLLLLFLSVLCSTYSDWSGPIDTAIFFLAGTKEGKIGYDDTNLLSGMQFVTLLSFGSEWIQLYSSVFHMGKCCLTVARYTNVTGDLGVHLDSSDICLHSISETFRLYGVPQDATEFCGLGTKIPVTYECKGRTTITQMAQSPGFGDVTRDCMIPFVEKSDCRKCINASIVYLHGITGEEDNVTLNTCRDATFAALASRSDEASAAGFAGCFFHAPGLSTIVSAHSSSAQIPTPLLASGPSVLSVGLPLNRSHHHYHLTVLPGIGIAVTVISLMLLMVVIFFIHRKSKELEDSEGNIKPSMGVTPRPPRPILKIQDGPSSVFRKFTYKETKKATNKFSTVIGQGGFGTVYKAEFSDGLVAAVKRMDRVSEQAEDEFCREIELVARLHHRHLVALKGFCIEKRERFLMYEYLENGSLKDHLHSQGRTPLSWQTRIQIAIDVANALEYLHFYCDPSLCHRDIKSSNILLDENLTAKVADFGLALASNDGSVCFEPINTDVRGTPGYMDPEYAVTRDLTEKSDIYSYGVVILELITARRAIQDNKNLVEWSKPFLASESRFMELVDPTLGDSFDYEQLKTLVEIVEWCTQGEGRARPSIKQVLRLLYESSDPIHNGFLQAVEDGIQGTMGKGKSQRAFHFGYLPSSSSTTRSYCSRSFLLDNVGSPQSPPNIPSV